MCFEAAVARSAISVAADTVRDGRLQRMSVGIQKLQPGVKQHAITYRGGLSQKSPQDSRSNRMSDSWASINLVCSSAFSHIARWYGLAQLLGDANGDAVADPDPAVLRSGSRCTQRTPQCVGPHLERQGVATFSFINCLSGISVPRLGGRRHRRKSPPARLRCEMTLPRSDRGRQFSPMNIAKQARAGSVDECVGQKQFNNCRRAPPCRAQRQKDGAWGRLIAAKNRIGFQPGRWEVTGDAAEGLLGADTPTSTSPLDEIGFDGLWDALDAQRGFARAPPRRNVDHR